MWECASSMNSFFSTRLVRDSMHTSVFIHPQRCYVCTKQKFQSTEMKYLMKCSALHVFGNGRQYYSSLVPHQMTLVSGLRLLRTVLVDRHSLPPWFVGFVTHAGILATFSVAFLVGRVWLMQGGPDIFNRYVWT